jgi:truncated hemoglobin YjbI
MWYCTNDDNKSNTLLERIGGESFVGLLLNSFYDELLELRELKPFFKYTPIETIKTHQSKLFRLILGSEEDKPKPGKMIDYMLASHSRLFRNYGLNETHFDAFATCFAQTMNSFDVAEDVIREIQTNLLPLRDVFKYGAEVAAKEIEIGEIKLNVLPHCSSTTVGTNIQVVLPNHPCTKTAIPSWLDVEMKKVTRKTTLREWTSNMLDRCSATGDLLLADVMMDIPIFQMDTYLCTFLQLAFVPSNAVDGTAVKLIKIIRYPRGSRKDPLPRYLFDRLVLQFGKTCDDMNVTKGDTKVILEKLRSYRKSFPNMEQRPTFGLKNPPQLLRNGDKEKKENSGKKKVGFYNVNDSVAIEVLEKSSPNKGFSNMSRRSFSSNELSTLAETAPVPINNWFGAAKASLTMNVNDNGF